MATYWSSLPAHNVLVRNQVHAVSCGSHHSHISNGVQRNLLIQRDWPLYPHDRLVAASAVLLVHPVHNAERKVMQLGDVFAA